MMVLFNLVRRSGRLWPSSRAGVLQRVAQLQWRYYSSQIAEQDGTLPLQGIRVLDMTRVLAGVSPKFLWIQLYSIHACLLKDPWGDCSRIVLRFLEI